MSARSAHAGATAFVPASRNLNVMRDAVQECRGCDLYKNATHAVFGELETPKASTAHVRARLMMVGEQPGDREDIEGRPFVGPAGSLLDRCVEETGIDRQTVYVTNAVKHFKWEPRGKLRIHKKPSVTEIRACRPWLNAEIEAVHPEIILCLGASAAQTLLGSTFRVTQQHGVSQAVEGLPPVVATLHPSAILRAVTDEDREHQTELFLSDLRAVKKLLRIT